MKYRNFLLLYGILLVAFALIGSCATRRKAISEEEFFEAYSGTWINTEYSGEGSWETQKVVLHPDGRRMEYALVTLDTWSWFGKDTITDMWKDSSGVIWYKASWENYHYNAKGHMMGKISDSGNTLELLSCMWGEPIEEWDLDNIHYHSPYTTTSKVKIAIYAVDFSLMIRFICILSHSSSFLDKISC